jgi:hypothetical protein
MARQRAKRRRTPVRQSTLHNALTATVAWYRCGPGTSLLLGALRGGSARRGLLALSSPRQALPEPHGCQDQHLLPYLYPPPQGEETGGRHPRQGARVTPHNGAHGRRTDRTASWEYPSSREVAHRLDVLPQGPDSPADLTVQELMALGR